MAFSMWDFCHFKCRFNYQHKKDIQDEIEEQMKLTTKALFSKLLLVNLTMKNRNAPNNRHKPEILNSLSALVCESISAVIYCKMNWNVPLTFGPEHVVTYIFNMLTLWKKSPTQLTFAQMIFVFPYVLPLPSRPPLLMLLLFFYFFFFPLFYNILRLS